MKIKLLTSSKMSDDQIKQLGEILKKNGSLSKSGMATTSKEDSFLKESILPDADYLQICKDCGFVSDGSHIKDESERIKYLENIDEKSEKKLDRTRILSFRGSDETVDRHGDIVRVDGWDLKNYKTNPIFLGFHDSHSMPVGRTLRVYKEKSDTGAPSGKSLMFNVYFPEGNDASDTAFKAFSDGLMNAVSVGFRVLDYNYPTSESERAELGLGRYGAEIKKAELLELSAVPLPANPNALQIKSIDKKDLFDRLGLEYSEEEKDENVEDFENVDYNSLKEAIFTLTKCVGVLTDLVVDASETMKSFVDATKNLELKVELSADNLQFKEVEPQEPQEIGEDYIKILAELSNKTNNQEECK